MPKSKRARVVHTSAVQKKVSRERNTALFETIQTAASAYQHIFVLRVANMRNTYLKAVRQHFSSRGKGTDEDDEGADDPASTTTNPLDSRLFFGKTKVLAKALGTTPADEHLPGLSGLAPYLTGEAGVFFTNRPPTEILEFFSSYMELDFARAGTRATRTFTVPAGTVYSRGGEISAEEDVPLAHSLETTVRKWGMPTRLEKGKVVLSHEYTVCEEGQELDSRQTALLKMFGVALAEFRVECCAYWSAGTESVTDVSGTGEGGGEQMDE